MNRPKRVGVGVRVKERKRYGQIGTVLRAVDNGVWAVKFDGGETEQKTYQSLAIYEAAYVNPSTPPKKLAVKVTRAAPRTGRRKVEDVECVLEDDEDCSVNADDDSVR